MAKVDLKVLNVKQSCKCAAWDWVIYCAIVDIWGEWKMSFEILLGRFSSFSHHLCGTPGRICWTVSQQVRQHVWWDCMYWHPPVLFPHEVQKVTLLYTPKGTWKIELALVFLDNSIHPMSVEWLSWHHLTQIENQTPLFLPLSLRVIAEPSGSFYRLYFSDIYLEIRCGDCTQEQ